LAAGLAAAGRFFVWAPAMQIHQEHGHIPFHIATKKLC